MGDKQTKRRKGSIALRSFTQAAQPWVGEVWEARWLFWLGRRISVRPDKPVKPLPVASTFQHSREARQPLNTEFPESLGILPTTQTSLASIHFIIRRSLAPTVSMG